MEFITPSFSFWVKVINVFNLIFKFKKRREKGGKKMANDLTKINDLQNSLLESIQTVVNKALFQLTESTTYALFFQAVCQGLI